MGSVSKKLPLFLFFASLFSLFIYSYSQIDLNLTISSNPIYQSLQGNLIDLGYYKRHISGAVFLAVISLLSISSYFILQQFSACKIKSGSLIFGAIPFILLVYFSYPAFSHDIFNYMFDAKILIFYRENPYFFKALDFPQDLWVRFMHWTHRVYPYGPVWLGITAVFYLAGMGKFTLTLLSFKAMFFIFYLGCGVLVYKISKLLGNKKPYVQSAYFLLNPLVIIETLISPHNEIAMAFFMLCGLYFIIRKDYLFSFFFIIFSASVKFLTGVLLLLYPLIILKRDFFNQKNIIKSSLFLLTFPLITLIILRESYPWYFVTFVPLIALLRDNGIKKSFWLLSTGLIFRYYPYLISGEYTESVSFSSDMILVYFLLLFIILSLFKKRFLIRLR